MDWVEHVRARERAATHHAWAYRLGPDDPAATVQRRRRAERVGGRAGPARDRGPRPLRRRGGGDADLRRDQTGRRRAGTRLRRDGRRRARRRPPPARGAPGPPSGWPFAFDDTAPAMRLLGPVRRRGGGSGAHGRGHDADAGRPEVAGPTRSGRRSPRRRRDGGPCGRGVSRYAPTPWRVEPRRGLVRRPRLVILSAVEGSRRRTGSRS